MECDGAKFFWCPESHGETLSRGWRNCKECAFITSLIGRGKNMVPSLRALKGGRVSWETAKKQVRIWTCHLGDATLTWNDRMDGSRRSRDVCKIDLLSCVSKRIKLSWQQLLFPRMRIKAGCFSCRIQDIRLSYPHDPAVAVLCKWSQTRRHTHFSLTQNSRQRGIRFLLTSHTM